MNNHKRYPLEIQELSVRLVLEHQESYRSDWAALTSIAELYVPVYTQRYCWK